MNILSLGAGVQSTTLALMFNEGLLGDLDCAIFADTQAEPSSVYTHLDWLEKQLDFPVHKVTKGNLEKDTIVSYDRGKRVASIPFFTYGLDGNKGMLRRQCTNEYKITPIYKKIRELLGLKPRQRFKGEATLYMGISLDEITRVTINPVKWIINTYPLIENNMTRQDCLKWLQEKGYKEPPKSACYFCPYHDNKTWKKIKDNDPESWDKAIEFDKQIREYKSERFKDNLFLHQSCKPLDEIDFDDLTNSNQMDLFLGECEGYCGV